LKARAAQREETRNRIVTAAAELLGDRGYRSTSTRQIADAAGVNQGLITYYFGSKEELWKAALDQLFGQLRAEFADLLSAHDKGTQKARNRELIRRYVWFCAEHPELLQLMVEEGRHHDDRLRWLADAHLKPMYNFLADGIRGLNPGMDPSLIPHVFYSIVGAASLIFAIAPECRRVTGLNPKSRRAIDAHADLLADMLSALEARSRKSRVTTD